MNKKRYISFSCGCVADFYKKSDNYYYHPIRKCKDHSWENEEKYKLDKPELFYDAEIITKLEAAVLVLKGNKNE